MKTAIQRLIFVSLLLSYNFAFAGLHHALELTLTPAIKTLAAKDTLAVTPAQSSRFLLNKNLAVRVTSAGDQLRLLRSAPATELANEYELTAGAEDSVVILEYSGVLFDPVTNNDSTGLISMDGAALFGSTYWVPEFGVKSTYEIHSVNLPATWVLASPKSQLKIAQPDHYLIAGAFTEYSLDTASGLPLKVFLRSPEPALAQTFLNLLPGYLDHYQTTLGSYPYQSFAVIENFWETGFGMPAFTLLGPGVIRLPYILNSSLPHELLHNWWGNGVFVDYQRGNWCEGLTTYLADHWQQSLTGNGREYRRQSLMNFQDYTSTGADFPLRDFKQRFNFSSQAIGYGKGMMLFHMLKVRLGETTFTQGLRDLYRNHLGHSISYEEIESSFANTSGKDLKTFFKQWLDRTGAPQLSLEQVQLDSLTGAKHQVSFELAQVSAQNYELSVPARVIFKDGSQRTEVLSLTSSHQGFQFTFDKAPKSLEIDPEVDVFRRLDISERPLGFSNVFGAGQIWMTGTDAGLVTAFQQTWQNSIEATITPSDDKILLDLPPAGAVVMLGENPRYEQLILQALAGQDFKVTTESLWILGADYPRKDFKTALVARSQTHPGLILAWVRGTQAESLAPRLLHYGKFSALAFAEKAVPLKATWPLLKSPLKFEF